MLVPGTEDEGDKVSVWSSEAAEECRDSIKPALEEFMFGAPRDYFVRCRSVVPGVASSYRIGAMPADGVDRTPGIGGTDMLADILERFSIDVFGVTEFDFGNIPAAYCRMASRKDLDVGL